MGAFEALSNYYDQPLDACAMELGYHISNIYILRGDGNRLRAECPQIYKNLISCRHNRDRRTPIEYGQDLVASWIFEDKLIADLRNWGLAIEKAGADRERMILSTRHVSAGSDTRININDNEIYMEIMCDYKGYWSRNLTAELRDDKFTRLSRENALFLGVDVINDRYMLIDFSKNVEARYIASHFAYGGKPAYSLSLRRYVLTPTDYRRIAEEIIQISQDR